MIAEPLVGACFSPSRTLVRRRVGYRAPEQVASGATSPVGGVRSNDTRKSGWSDFAVRIPQGEETSPNQTLSMYKFSQAPRLPTEGVVLNEV